MDLDAGLVGWEGQDDPKHPRNYPERRKWALLGIVSGITFLRFVIHLPVVPFLVP